MRTNALLAAGAAFGLVAVGSVAAHQRDPLAGGSEPGPLWRAAEVLGLTDRQKADLSEIEELGRAEHERLDEAWRAARRRLRQELEAGSPDPGVVGEAAIEIHRLEAQQRVGLVSLTNAFESLLTTDQLRRWERMQAAGKAGGRSFLAPGVRTVSPLTRPGARPASAEEEACR